MLDRCDRRVDVVDADIAEPGRPGAVLLHLVGQRQHAAGEAAVGAADHAIALEFGDRLADVPADDRVVEGLRGVGIGGHQLVPDEAAVRGRRVVVAGLRGRGRVGDFRHGLFLLFAG